MLKKAALTGLSLDFLAALTQLLVAVLAVDALGADRVDAVMMPSPYTSQISLDDAKQLAENLGINLRNLDIDPSMQSVDAMLADVFAEASPDLARENLQSRLRGLTLMSISNTTGQMVLTTGNKSEYATGYATLYGDMCGGYARRSTCGKPASLTFVIGAIKTSPKARSGPENGKDGGLLIPERIITRPPSAELRPDQQDSDSLPDYDILDGIMAGLVEQQSSVDTLIAAGFDADLVRRCAVMLKRAEYKRRQCAPGPKLTRRAFYRDRRFPIINRFALDNPSSSSDFD